MSTARIREIIRPGQSSEWCAEAGAEWQICGYGSTPSEAAAAARREAVRQALAWRRQGTFVGRQIARKYVQAGRYLILKGRG